MAGVGLAVTDAIAPPDERLSLSAAAGDTPNAVDDGPVVATALARVEGDDVLAVVDGDDPGTPSAEPELRAVLD